LEPVRAERVGLAAKHGNRVQVQRWLGHHKASFTLDTYVHLLSGDLGEPLDLSAELVGQGEFEGHLRDGDGQTRWTRPPVSSNTITRTVSPPAVRP
jgi:hypothetical protein